MTRPKILRCTEPGCRTLTAAGKCDRHREPVQAVETSLWGITPEQWQAAGAKASAQWEQIKREAAQRASLRTDLKALQYGAEKAARRAERPVFSGEC